MFKFIKEWWNTQQRAEGEPEVTYQEDASVKKATGGDVIETNKPIILTFPDGKEFTWIFDRIDMDRISHLPKVNYREENTKVSLDYENLNKINTMTPPASQLFMLLLKDQKNITTSAESNGVGMNLKTSNNLIVKHKILNISVEIEFDRYCNYFTKIKGTTLSQKEFDIVYNAWQVYRRLVGLDMRAEKYAKVMQERKRRQEIRNLDKYLGELK